MEEGAFMSGIKSCYGSITVEPILFLYNLAGSFQWPTVDAMIYRKVCLELYNQTICDNLDTLEHKDEEDVVQTHTSYWYLANNLCFEIPAIATSFFYGTLSDKFSRKTALMLPLIGQMITLAVYFLNAVFFSLPVGFVLIGQLISGLFGGWITCCLAAYSYLSDVSSTENRAIRIAMGESMESLSISVGFFISGVTLDHTNFPTVLGISFLIYTIAFLYCRFRVKDLNTVRDNGECKVENAPKKTCCNVVGNLCSGESLRDTFSVILKEREGRYRAYIIILLFGMFSGVLCGSASWLIGYLYLRRQPLSWNQSLYGYFVSVKGFLASFFLLAVMPLLKKVFRMRDTVILILSTLSQALAEAFFSISTTTWMVFMVPIIGFVGGARATCTRAILSQLVDPSELGKMFAFVGSLQSTGILIATFTYNTAYPATLSIWAGICFAAGAVFTIIPIAMFVWVDCDMRKTSQYERLELEDLSIHEATEKLIDYSTHGKNPEDIDIEDFEICNNDAPEDSRNGEVIALLSDEEDSISDHDDADSNTESTF